MTTTPPDLYLTANEAELWLTTPGFDDLLLTGETTDDDGNTFTLMAQADASWGSPAPVDVAVQRWMTDGAVASTQGHENRELPFNVKVSASTAGSLAAGEAALARRAGGPGLLTWVPPTGRDDTQPTVFEVWTWHLDHTFDLDRELRMARMYAVTMTAKPWARSAGLVTVAALPAVGSPTVTPIDACTSTTGWTGLPNAPTTSGGAVRESRAETFGTTSRTLTRTGTVSGLGSLPYLVLDMAVTGGNVSSYTVKVDGTPLALAATSGTLRYYALPTGTTSFSTLQIVAAINVLFAGTVALAVNDVSGTDFPGGIGSHKQLFRTLDVGGSVPSSGSIELASPSATVLGTCLVYSCPDTGSGYTPPLRQYRTAGNTVTADAAAVSGSHEAFVTAGGSLGAGITYTEPAGLLAEGTYVVLGRFHADAATTLTATLTAGVGSGPVDTIVGKVVFAAAGWQWGVLGVLSLPTQPVPVGTALNEVVNITGTATALANVTLDELYLLDVTHGALSLINAGATATKLWLDAPDADPVRNRPAVYLGTLDDRSDAVGAPATQIMALGDHDLDPGGSVLVTVTDNVNDALAQATFYQRWHTHAGA